MHTIILILISVFSVLKSFSQAFISDSLMEICVNSGYANNNFIPKGESKNDIRIGKWNDYTFEFILSYSQTKYIVDENLEHLLIESLGKYSDGKKNGKWIYYGIENETMKRFHLADVTFKNDKKDGPITFYYSSGEKAAVGSYYKDELNGSFIVYFKTGEIERKYEILNGTIQGELTYYYKSGEKEIKVHFTDGKKEGEEIGFYKNGIIKRERTFINNTLQGDSKIYYPNGKIQEVGQYMDGKLINVKYYYESGQLWVNKQYKEEKYYNILELYDSSGHSLDPGSLKDGTGTVKFYTENAKVYLIRTFKEGVIVKEEEF